MNPYNRSQPRLTLVGAGPGDPDLITVKGAQLLASADVILYDALVDPDLLVYARPSAELVFVGKRAGKHHLSQEEINSLIVSYALSCGHVVRLKGGDPFIFGRGFEEIEFAEAFGIETDVVPGISSLASVPGLQKIPLTKRGLNQSLWAVTGTTATGALSPDLKLAARSTATVVIFMGMRKLPEITALFAEIGKGETPAAVIQGGSTEKEKIVLGKVSDIAEKARAEQIGTPGLIVIGETVGLHPELREQVFLAKPFINARNEHA